MERRDVIVLGGSIGGATTALRLAQKGLRVALIEKDKIHKRKACGEGLSLSGVQCLLELGLDDILSLSSVQLQSYAFFSSVASGKARKISPGNWGVGLDRARFLELLEARIASSNNLQLICREREGRVSRTAGGFVAETSAGTLVAPYIVVADGGSSPNSRSLQLPEVKTRGGRLGVSCHGTLHSSHPDIADSSTVGVFMDRWFQCYLTPLGANRFNLSGLFDKAGKGGADTLLQQMKEKLSLHNMTFSVEGKLTGASHIGAIRRPSYKEGAFVIGDSAEQLDPVGGMGMTHALISGRLAAQSILSLFKGQDERVVISRHLRTYSRGIRKLRGFTRLSQLMTKGSGIENLRFLLLGSPLTSLFMHEAHRDDLSDGSPFIRSCIDLLGVMK